MKITRHKRVIRSLNFYKNNFGFRSPYQILLDGTFCHFALKYKINIRDQVPKYMNEEVKLMTTACVVTETELMGSATYGAMLIVKQFQVRKCCHEKNPIAASDCLYSMIQNGNPDHYFVATQDPELTNKIREKPGTPLLYVKLNAIVLEKPSEMSEEKAAKINVQKLQPTDYQTLILNQIKKEKLLNSDKNIRKKRKKIKGPNPLSCKKKKVKPPKDLDNTSGRIRKRKRKTVKISVN